MGRVRRQKAPGAIGHAAIGSAWTELACRAPCPVLVVNGEEKDFPARKKARVTERSMR